MVIGIRSFPDGFTYIILDGTQSNPTLIKKERLTLPVGISWAESLSWIRRQVEEIFDAHQIISGCIKTIEHNARKKSAERIQIEAIIIEYLFSIRQINCEVRVKSQIKRAIPRFREPARYLDRLVASHINLRELNIPIYQEATEAAISVLPID